MQQLFDKYLLPLAAVITFTFIFFVVSVAHAAF